MKIATGIVIGLCLFISVPITHAQLSGIRRADFRNFSFPATDHEDFPKESFTLKNGFFGQSRGNSSQLESIYYGGLTGVDDEVALVAVAHHDGNATYHTLYVFHVVKRRLKLMQSFTFGDGLNTHLGSAFTAHGELIIETYLQKPADPECCASVIETRYYRWNKDRFVLQGTPREAPNGYVERIKPKP